MKAHTLIILGLLTQGAPTRRSPTPQAHGPDRARRWLLAHEESDGSFAPARRERFRRGITAVCALALGKHGAAALRHLAAGGAEGRGTSAYGQVFATWSLCAGMTKDTRFAARKAVNDLLARQGEDGAWSDAISPHVVRAETCLTALALLALHAAKSAGIDVPANAVTRGVQFLEARYLRGRRMFTADEQPTPSNTATALATVALLRWGRGASSTARGGLKTLTSMAPGGWTRVLSERTPILGYRRDHGWLGLFGYSLALRESNGGKAWQRVRARVGAALRTIQASDGSFDSAFGKPFATAMALLVLPR